MVYTILVDVISFAFSLIIKVYRYQKKASDKLLLGVTFY